MDIWNGKNNNDYRYSLFIECTSLKEITVDDGVTIIPQYGFKDQTSFETILLANSVTNISVCAFDGNSGLRKIWIGKDAASIGKYAFRNCSNLTIHGISGSYTEEYATTNNIAFSTETLIYERVDFQEKLLMNHGKVLMVQLYTDLRI